MYLYKYRSYRKLQESGINDCQNGGGGSMTIQHQQIPSQCGSSQETIVSPDSTVDFVVVHTEFQGYRKVLVIILWQSSTAPFVIYTITNVSLLCILILYVCDIYIIFFINK